MSLTLNTSLNPPFPSSDSSTKRLPSTEWLPPKRDPSCRQAGNNNRDLTGITDM
jgi:hypothetical protein